MHHQPRSPESFNALGNAFKAQGRLSEAAACYHDALACDPTFTKAHNNLGNVFQDRGMPDQAVACYRRALLLNPDFPVVHNNLGNALKALGRREEALACYRRALELGADFPQVYNNLGLVLAELGRLEEAIACYRRAIAGNPDDPQAHNNLGAALAAQGRHDQALACYRRAIVLAPEFPEALNNLGNALKEYGQLDEAVLYYHRSIAGQPNAPQVHSNLGTVLKEQGALDEAIACYGRALELKPDFPEVHSNLGAALAQQGHLDEAIACYHRAIALDPACPEPHNNLGTARKEQGQLDEAVACYRHAIRLRPDFAGAHNNLGIALLARGDFAEGWAEYEWRWHTPEMSRARRGFPQPQWRGEQAAGKTLFIHAEQGFGDTLQFCRYGPLAAARGLTVLMQVPKALRRLLTGLPGVDIVLPRGAELPAFDFHCPMLSLPLALGTTRDTIPGTTPYLTADAAQAASWRQRLGPPHGALRVGLVWAGNARNRSPALVAVDRRRSIPPALLAPLFEVTGVRMFSLQKFGPAPPASFALTDVMDEMADFADTAALIANLDLVISVDTAVAHLAAALGKPVWLLDRFDSCWRWLNGRRDSPWYPSLRLYRQPAPGAWEPVVAEVARDLGALTNPQSG